MQCINFLFLGHGTHVSGIIAGKTAVRIYNYINCHFYYYATCRHLTTAQITNKPTVSLFFYCYYYRISLVLLPM